MSECEELVKRLRAKKKAAGFKSGLSEDGGHRVAEMQYVPDPDAQEAATLITALAAEKEALEARIEELEAARQRGRNERDADAKDYCALMEKRDAEFVRAEAAEARVRELEETLEFYRDEWVQKNGFVVASAALTADKGRHAGRAGAPFEEGHMTDWNRIDDPENPPPKDGTLMWIATDRERMIGWYMSEDDYGYACEYPWCFLENDGLVNGMRDGDPTHWQPLVPPPPVTLPAEGEPGGADKER
jgi:hypothetical protein